MGGCPTHSFDAETLVSTIQGKIPISELQEGDWVLAYHELTGELGYYPVTKTWVHIDPIIITLVIDGELIETTPNHPFYTDEGWLGAGDLWVGAKVVRANGQLGQVESINVETTPQLMYDLTVDVAHTYFVGRHQWLVHNCEEFARLGTNWESTGRLSNQAQTAENGGWPHGVSVMPANVVNDFARDPLDVSIASRTDIENAGFTLHHTPSRRNPDHYTLELPKPVTSQVARVFNQLFGRSR